VIKLYFIMILYVTEKISLVCNLCLIHCLYKLFHNKKTLLKVKVRFNLI